MNLVFIAKRSVRFVVTNQCASERFTIDSVMGSQRFRANPALYAGRHIQANQQDHHKRQSERERPQRRTQMHVLRDQRTTSPGFRQLTEELVTLLAYEATRGVHVEPLTRPWPPSEQTLPVEIRALDLAQLLALIDVPGLSASGRLSGLLYCYRVRLTRRCSAAGAFPERRVRLLSGPGWQTAG